MANETIKAKVIHLVQKDPFLSIDEIAAQVETTLVMSGPSFQRRICLCCSFASIMPA